MFIFISKTITKNLSFFDEEKIKTKKVYKLEGDCTRENGLSNSVYVCVGWFPLWEINNTKLCVSWKGLCEKECEAYLCVRIPYL